MSDSVNISRDTDAAPDRVWAVLTDIDAAPQILEHVTEVEKLTDGPYRVGTRWRETREVLGAGVTQEMEVLTSEALGKTQIATHVNGVDYTTTFTLTARHPGTTLSVSIDGAPQEEVGTLKRLANKVTGAVANKALHSAMTKDVEQIIEVAEGRREVSPDAPA